jgi:tellurite resistance protein TerC
MLASTNGNLALSVSLWEWVVVVGVVTTLIVVDLFVLNKKHEVPTIRTAAVQTLMYVSVGAVFGLWIWFQHGGAASGLYYSAWLIEYSLSVDNVFVWSIILTFFAVPRAFQHRLLFWGIFGALILRFVFITAGATFISHFSWATIPLGLIVIWSAYKVFTSDDEDEDISQSWLYRKATKFLPIASDNELTEAERGHRFIVRKWRNGKRRVLVTVLGICLIVLEGTDLLFAVDSVPASLAITVIAFLIFCANSMAILGLRALYFLFDAIKAVFTRLNEGLAIILFGVGLKLILASTVSVFGLFTMPGIHIPTSISLGSIAFILLGSIVASKIWPEAETAEVAS